MDFIVRGDQLAGPLQHAVGEHALRGIQLLQRGRARCRRLWPSRIMWCGLWPNRGSIAALSACSKGQLVPHIVSAQAQVDDAVGRL